MTPSTEWKEVIPEGEAALHEQLAERLRALQRRRAKGGKAARGLHAKGQSGLEAQLTVLPDLPEYARVGIFAAPATFDCYVRVSNGANQRQADAKPDVRGIALKILGVPGRKLIPGMEDATTHDLLLIRSSSTPFPNAEEFIAFVEAAANPATLLPKVLMRFGLRGLSILKQMVAGLAQPMHSVATTTYFSALPTTFGPYAVRWSLEPLTTTEAAKGGKRGANYLGDELAGRLREAPVSWNLRVQFFKDEASTPIEDASRDWSEADAPWVTLAKLTISKQDPASERGRKLGDYVETLSFDPWHAPVEFRPLGNMMRARNAAYRLSTQERGAAKEPKSRRDFDEAA